MSHHNFPNYDGNESPASTLVVLVLWIVTLLISVVNNAIHNTIHEPVTGITWLDISINILSKLAPAISTLLIYIINRKEINKFVKNIFKKKS
jgi:hypothetical protein